MKKSSILIIIILVIIIILTIFVDYIIKNKKKIYIMNNIDLQMNDITNDIINNIDVSIKNNIVISLTTIPTRFITNDFDIIIKNLSNQKLKPKLIIINICRKYNRKFVYDEKIYQDKLKIFESKFDKVKINMCDDYGPATKILGLEEVKLNPNDSIIILDDDMKYNLNLTTFYALGYDIYNTDGITIHESIKDSIIDSYVQTNFKNMLKIKHTHIYHDNYTDNLFGWCSFSFKFKNIQKIINLSKEILNKDKNIWKHDDALFTYCYKKLNLNLIGMYLCQPDITTLGYQNSLMMNNIINFNYRKELENKYNVLDYKPNNKYNDTYNIKIINDRIFIITIETSKINIKKELYLNLNNNNVKLELDLPYNKQTIFCETNFNLLKK